MQPLGTITVGPSDLFKDLGPFSIGPDDDTIWLDITQLQPTENWRYSYGLVSFITAEGAELGTTKVYGNQLGEVYKLGVGRAPLDRSGIIRFRPRSYNLSWIDAEGAPQWELEFKWESGESGSGSPVFGTRATLGSLADLAAFGVTYAINSGIARVSLTRKP